jgi:hypothetical protein
MRLDGVSPSHIIQFVKALQEQREGDTPWSRGRRKCDHDDFSEEGDLRLLLSYHGNWYVLAKQVEKDGARL